MATSDSTIPFDDFPPQAEAALSEWSEPRRSAHKGRGFSVGPVSFKLSTEDNGQFRMANFGAGIAASLACNAAFHPSTGLAGAIGFGAYFAGSAASMAVADASKAWRSKRSDGAGKMEAFTAFSQSLSHLIRAKMPNGLYLPMAGLGIAAFAFTTVAKALGPGPNPNLASKAANAAASATLSAASLAAEASAGFQRWKAGHAIQAASFQGSSAANECYAAMDDARASLRWACPSGSWEDHQAPASMLTRRDTEQRDKFQAFVSMSDRTMDGLLHTLVQIQASGVPAWHSPAPGLPTIAAMAGALHRRIGGTRGPDDPVGAILNAMDAQCEARDIRGFVGEAASPCDPARRPRL